VNFDRKVRAQMGILIFLIGLLIFYILHRNV